MKNSYDTKVLALADRNRFYQETFCFLNFLSLVRLCPINSYGRILIFSLHMIVFRCLINLIISSSTEKLSAVIFVIATVHWQNYIRYIRDSKFPHFWHQDVWNQSMYILPTLKHKVQSKQTHWKEARRNLITEHGNLISKSFLIFLVNFTFLSIYLKMHIRK